MQQIKENGELIIHKFHFKLSSSSTSILFLIIDTSRMQILGYTKSSV